jgi:hypothetical protein
VDPISNLSEQLAIANRIANDPDYPNGGDIYQDTERLAELVLALDEWMRKGGFSPWTKARNIRGFEYPPLDFAPRSFGTHIREAVAIIKDWWRK